MPLWQRATEKVTNHAIGITKKSFKDTVVEYAPVVLTSLGMLIGTILLLKEPKQPVYAQLPNIIININKGV